MIAKTVFKVILASLVLGFFATACDVADNAYNESAGYPPEVEMCQVHITFYENWYEDEGVYVWDKVRIKNGQSNSAKVTMTFDGSDIEALEHTVWGQGDANYHIWIPDYTDVHIKVDYKNDNDDWVGCPSNPVRIGL